MFNNICNWFYGIKDTLSVMGSIVIIVTSIALIVALAYFAIKMPSKIGAVIFSTIGTVLLMIPVVTSFNAIVDKKAINNLAKKYQDELSLKKKEIELVEKEKEIEKQKLVNLRQKLNIETLENEVTLLKNSQLQINNYKEIAEVNLLETNLKQTTVSKTQIGNVKDNNRGWWMFSDKYREYDDVLVVLTHDIVAKFGFDINEVKIMDSEEMPNAILVSQIKPKFTGTTKNDATKVLTEVRHFELDDQKANKEIDTSKFKSWKDYPSKYKHGSILFEREAEAMKYADKVIKEFNKRLSQGLETEFLNKPLEELCKKFISSILLPLNKQIIFVKEAMPNALSIDEYFKTKIETKENKIKEVKNESNDEIIKKVDKEIEM